MVLPVLLTGFRFRPWVVVTTVAFVLLTPICDISCPAKPLMNETVHGPPLAPATATLPFKAGMVFRFASILVAVVPVAKLIAVAFTALKEKVVEPLRLRVIA